MWRRLSELSSGVCCATWTALILVHSAGSSRRLPRLWASYLQQRCQTSCEYPCKEEDIMSSLMGRRSDSLRSEEACAHDIEQRTASTAKVPVTVVEELCPTVLGVTPLESDLDHGNEERSHLRDGVVAL
eukprot:SRR837773.4270.p1 GENE.SRR837773.4270~~SRR837773.4270.p1  ORF type:complete len:129 (-),score=9.07 SRR837773.4270:277-663(-)